jgi:hypothetical protein
MDDLQGWPVPEIPEEFLRTKEVAGCAETRSQPSIRRFGNITHFPPICLQPTLAFQHIAAAIVGVRQHQDYHKFAAAFVDWFTTIAD